MTHELCNKGSVCLRGMQARSVRMLDAWRDETLGTCGQMPYKCGRSVLTAADRNARCFGDCAPAFYLHVCMWPACRTSVSYESCMLHAPATYAADVQRLLLLVHHHQVQRTC